MAYSTPPGENNDTDATVYGGFYQWGRAEDGHQVRNSPGIKSQATVFNEHGQPSESTHAGKFIHFSEDWRKPSSNTLWYNNGKTVNDPCPPGWRVPTQAEWSSILNGGTTEQNNIPSTGVTTTSGNFWKRNIDGTRGWTVSPDGGNTVTLFLPAAGYRNHGAAIWHAVSRGYYWSSSPSSEPDAYYFSFTPNEVLPAKDFYRAAGLSIRCVAE
jgi:uncharacterized protein (TIGR02145 family)